ncbi:glutathionylspermidine synthase family protein [Tanticharoenia sakaeratensis]|uniref:Glutathionylspermidine synthase pre-ATP-grasp-like domain-containing protein n=1 Tax=Tanticharoenia sakaeratensis NBRC 103193 TaxID=1231623 RepID=A0A0D6MJK4_9PROT|nr:glutathionylspermidine synthase family protein [Tanticharoenia sakaeratensis]GAN53666.1 hypothetical protein Tasa_010_213 [Tanticharoenia sakaeratensis NBRC 103193]GBQ17235.1 hypothetical protein AA103193_0274 [Tanticharoenia sakaeratensis NBRC 103193]
MFRDAGARHLQDCGCIFLNPPWTSLLSNKALLPALWDRRPGHPRLLRAGATPKGMASYAEKPIHGRGGENVGLVRESSEAVSRGGGYGAYPRIYQALADQRVDGVPASVGAWIVGNAFAGITMRENAGGIARNAVICHDSPIVPHVIRSGPARRLMDIPARMARRFASGAH